MSQNPGPAAGSHSTQPQPGTTSQPGQTTTAQYQPQYTSQGVYNPGVPSTTMNPGGSPNYYSPGPMVGQSPGMAGGAYAGGGYGVQGHRPNNTNRIIFIVLGVYCACCCIFLIIFFSVGGTLRFYG